LFDATEMALEWNRSLFNSEPRSSAATLAADVDFPKS